MICIILSSIKQNDGHLVTYSVFFVCFLVFVKSGVIFPDESHNLRRYIIVLIELFDSFGLESGFYSS